jgi:hypothetical protein
MNIATHFKGNNADQDLVAWDRMQHGQGVYATETEATAMVYRFID